MNQGKTSFLKTFESLFLYFTFIFVAMFAHPKLTYEFSTSKYFFLIVFFTISMTLFLLRKYLDKDKKMYISWAHIGWFVFGVAAVVSTFTVLRENPIYFSFSFEIGIYALLTFFMVFYFSNFLDSKRTITYFLLAVMISGTMVAIEALFNYYTGQSFFLGSYGSGGKMSVKATIGNPNFVSDFLGSLLPLTVYFALSYDFGWKPKEKKPGMKFFIPIMVIKAAGIVNFAIFYFMVLVIGTRGVTLSLMIGGLVFVIAWIYYRWSRRKEGIEDNEEKIRQYSGKMAGLLKKTNMAFLIAILFIALLLPIILSNPENTLAKGVNVAERTSSIFDTRGFQTTGGKVRVYAWKASIYQWKDNPLIGSGIGTYMLDAVDYMGEVVQAEPEYVDAWSNFKRTHNDYLQVLGEIGIFGFVSILFTLIVMLIMFFRILAAQKNQDDALLLILLATGFTVILGHSFTEFPLHLLPNQLWAITLGGLGFGKYFNQKRFLAFDVRLHSKGLFVLLGVVVIVGAVSGTLKYKSMMAEAKFKEGNGYYSSLNQIQSNENQLKQQRNQVQELQKQLQNREGQYAKFQKEVYIQSKKAEMGSMAQNMSDEELNMKLLNDLSQEIEKEQQKLQGYLNEIDQKLEYLNQESFTRYNRALNDFLSSLDHSNCYGKSMFYLSLMMVRPERKELLYNEVRESDNALQTLEKQFTEKQSEEKYIQQEDLDFPLKGDIQALKQMLADDVGTLNELLQQLNLSLWYDIEMYQSGVDYFESAFDSFNEKNAYRIMGKFNYNLSVMLKNLASKYISIVQKKPDMKGYLSPLIAKHQEQHQKALEDFQHWYDTAIYKLPANWQMFPDWENIYAEYIDLLLKSGSVTDVYPKVREVAEKRVWAAEKMHEVQRTGIPDDVSSVYSQIAQAFLEKNMYQEALFVLDDGLKMLANAYKWGVDDLKNNPYLSDKEKGRLEKFINTYETLIEKRKTFLDQILSVYRYAKEQGNFKDKWLDDWKYNQFTEERWPDANYEDIMERVMEAANNPPAVLK